MDPQTFVQESNPILLCVVIMLSLVFLFKIQRSRKQNWPPSPPKLPIIGNLHQLSALPYKSFSNLSKKYGPIMLLHLGNIPTLVVSSLEIAKEITKNHDIVFAGRPTSTGGKIVLNGCLGMGFGPYSDHVRETKNLCVLQLLSQKRVQQFHFIRKEEVEKIVEKIRIFSINRSAFNISDMFMSLAHNILSRSAFGCLYENEDGKYKSFGEVAGKTMELTAKFCFKDVFPILGWIDHLTGLIGNLKNTSKELNDFLDRVIEDRLALVNEGEKLEDKKYLVDILLYLQRKRIELDLSNDCLKTILKVMFIGGINPIAVTMEWMMAELMKNPEIRKKAQEEIRRVVGMKSETTQAEINEMKYLKCIVKETVRFHVSAMMNRETSASVKLQGYDIPPKTRVIINTWAIQRDPKFWDRPEEFIPERFLNHCDIDDDDCSRLLAFSFSFGKGRRACPGMSYAYAEIEYVLANLLYWFDWELPNRGSGVDLDMEEVFTISISKKILFGLWQMPIFLKFNRALLL